MERWPNFFIVGAPKAGTTSLHEYLNEIPEIFMSSQKEPNYFSSKSIGKKFRPWVIRDKKEYLLQFEEGTNMKYIGESSGSYLSDPDAPKLIHEVSPHAKIIISLRDPVERLYSHYLMLKSRDHIDSSLSKQIDLELKYGIDIEKHNIGVKSYSLYYENIQRYIDIFGSQQVKILIFEEWVKNVKKTVEEILKFLDLNYELTDFKEEIHNPYAETRGPLAAKLRKSKSVKKLARMFLSSSTRKLIDKKILHVKKPKPILDDSNRKLLKKLYIDDVKKLENLLNHKISWPNF